ncbi:MAG: GRP family sugar transporter [Salinivirgaceae bacterium]|jgi:glucose uptake protein|nr:GRP family sugar transporter [Salinivirgaceae bacterium]
MYLIESNTTAIIFSILSMLCWGSWVNSQKIAAKSWRFELFYWDYNLGLLFAAIIFAFTLGNLPNSVGSFPQNLADASWANIAYCIVGGIIFNISNILMVMAVAVAGMAVAVPVTVGIALVLGVIINYFGAPSGNPVWIFTGVFFVVISILFNAMAYKSKAEKANSKTTRGLLLAISSGLLMSLFYRFVARTMPEDFTQIQIGQLSPYTAVFIFIVGVLLSNVVLNTLIMRKPIEGAPVKYRDYFSGNIKNHMAGIIGGIIWCAGMMTNILGGAKAGFAISYGLGQGATIIAALWGIFIWKEFKGAPQKSNVYLALMMVLFAIGVVFLILARYM